MDQSTNVLRRNFCTLPLPRQLDMFLLVNTNPAGGDKEHLRDAGGSTARLTLNTAIVFLYLHQTNNLHSSGKTLLNLGNQMSHWTKKKI